MTTIEIKKVLYKEKPIATRRYTVGDYVYYETKLKNGTTLMFHVPKEELTNTFEDKMSAQLLIRWLSVVVT